MRNFTPRTWILTACSILVVLSFILSTLWQGSTFLLYFSIALLIFAVHDSFFSGHTLIRIYPVFGRLRYVFETIRPEIQQYFVESNINGRPINREFRSLVYQRAKGVQDTRPFGTQFDVERSSYEWLSQSLVPKAIVDHNPRVKFGGKDCLQPYMASPLNISAMSFGALSKHAILALNKGAKLGGFAHNTGEGGLSPYHLQYGGDLIWQIGTGYFGCRTPEGTFSETLFAEKSVNPAIKMIEIKLSQGAKPGHGGILPAIKLTQEIADIRHVPMGQDVISPPAHSAFSTPIELLHYVQKLRQLSGGKPVGFKLSIGRKDEFLAICKAMLQTQITPDFITVDGGEGGTGAAPIEFTNSVGMPLRDALLFVNNALTGCGLRQEIKLIASGKAFSAFHIARLIALGADTVNAARAMMLALGCIQSRHCNTDKCPTGIATQDARRYNALDVDEKGQRVFKFQQAMIKNLMELLGAMGLTSLSEISPAHINRRIQNEVKTFEQLYQYIDLDCLLNDKTVPENWQSDWQKASSEHW